jgi:phage minor structural protein
MIIYFADRDLEILGNASTRLPDGFRIHNDLTVEEIDTGVNTFSCVISYTQDDRADLEPMVAEGNYILKQSARGDDDNAYDSVYQIIEVECDTSTQEYSIYAEDAGLDLLNTLCPAVTLTGNIGQMMNYFLPNDWSLNPMDVPTTSRTYTWDGESTCTERLLSVANLWGCELYYSFVIDRLQITDRVVNVIEKRGNQEAIPQLRLNYDLKKIYWKKSIAELVTALAVTGGTPDGSDNPINLKGYNYSYTDPSTGEVYRVDTATGQMRNETAMAKWSSAIDPDGLWVGSFQFDTTDKATLAGQARAYLQRHSQVEVTYEVDFEKLPDDIQIGDRVNIIDEDGELYLEARLLRIETCEAEDTQTATIGEYILRDSGISDKVAQMASELASLSNKLSDYQLTITSSNGSDFTTTLVNTTLTANILFRGVRVTANMLDQADLQVCWYDQSTGTRVGIGMTYTITNQQKVNITARLEDK